MNLDGFALPVKKLQSTNPVETLDLSGKNLGVASAVVIASLICANCALTSLDISNNSLCGVNAYAGTYTAEGITAIADALRVNGGLTKISLAKNVLGEEGTKAICEALEQNKTLKELDISGDRFEKSTIGGTAGAKHVAKMLGVNGALTGIDLSGNQLCGIWTDDDGDQNGTYTAEGITAIADALRVNGGLTSLNLSSNQLCGLDHRGRGTYTAEGITAIADALRVNGALTELSLAQNKLEEEGTKAICEALEQNTTLKELDISGGYEGDIGGSAGAKHVAKMLGVNGALTSLDLSNNQLCGLNHYGRGTYTAEGITAIADALLVNSTLTKLSLAQNKLEEAGTKAICEALEQNMTLKELDIRREFWIGSNTGGSAGAKHVAKMVRVNGGLTSIDLSGNKLSGIWTDSYGNQRGAFTAEGITAIADALRVNGALTVTNLLGNQLDAESAKMLAEVAKQKGISLCGIQRDQTTADFSNQNLKPPDAILLASDLLQADVTGGLTSLNLSSNELCGLHKDGCGTYTAEGIAAIADALRVNGGLTSLDLSNNALCGVTRFGGTYTAEGITAIADALRVNGALTECDLSHNGLGEEGKASIRFAAQGKAGFKLHL